LLCKNTYINILLSYNFILLVDYRKQLYATKSNLKYLYFFNLSKYNEINYHDILKKAL